MIKKQCSRCNKHYTLKTEDDTYIHTCTPGLRDKDGNWIK